MTNLKGAYNIDLTWIPDYDDFGSDGQKDKGMVSVIEEQLGLRMEKRNMLFEILVVDHAERKPTPN